MSAEHDKVLIQTADLYRKHGGNMSRGALSAKVARSTFQQRVAKAVDAGLLTRIEKRVVEPTPAETVAKHKEQNAAKRESHALRVVNKELEERNEELRGNLELALALQARKNARFVIPRYEFPNSEAVANLVASDWHVEERVRAGDVSGGLNLYTPDIAKARATAFFQHGLSLVSMYRHTKKIDTLVLYLLGDFITGFIHPELVESNYMSPTRATEFAMELLNSGIEYLLSKGDFKKIILPCCHGNHGRTTDKPRAQTSADNSFEYLMYRVMQNHCWSKEKRLEWHITEGYHQYVRLFDTTIRAHHGDSVNYQGGSGGITIPVLKAIHQWNTIPGGRADLDVFGHFHQLLFHDNFVSNGSLIGFGAYALRVKATYQKQRQAFFLIDRKEGPTDFNKVFVDA